MGREDGPCRGGDKFRRDAAVVPLRHVLLGQDGFRRAFIGPIDGSMLFGAAIIGGFNVALFVATWLLIAVGYKIKS